MSATLENNGAASCVPLVWRSLNPLVQIRLLFPLTFFFLPLSQILSRCPCVSEDEEASDFVSVKQFVRSILHL